VNPLSLPAPSPAATAATTAPARPRPFPSLGPPPRPGRGTGSPATPGAAGSFPASATAFLERVERARAGLDAALAEARRGRTFTPAELLGLQADAHRFAQTVEIAARGVEHGVQSLRQALQAQV